ncbi:23S rRNA (uracil(1939)-C(5))-methyltransferase RlmD [Salinibius halmophilus]|uniref:23S rRNA (uracil(1939)-C(5))-methyltransferase RlmD n=1 Tax=Salinibius halmophilus TaxID=1853216 RepID=UPI000E66EBAB|nr:23S rRNA (uracil(1939)-C(5))-methyltransferase RlmD [Salinibius halmophilus]
MQLQIDTFSHDGRGIGRVQDKGKRFGKTCFVEGALPGETVSVEISKENRRLIEASLADIDVPHPQRVQPECRYYQQCGGCQLQHADIALQRSLKEDVLVGQFQRLAQLNDIQLSESLVSEPWHTRRRVRFSIKGETLGFNGRGSNKIVDIKTCLIADQRINQHLPDIKRLLPMLKGATGLEVIANEPLVVDVLAKQPLVVSPELAAYCEQKQLSLWHKGKLLAGPAGELAYQIDSVTFQYNASHFSQVNAAINEQMVRQALAWAAPKAKETVLDLFCGIGNFALSFAPHVKAVVGVEGSEHSIQQAQVNAQLNQLSNCQFLVDNLFEPSNTWASTAADIVVLDPPRAGAQQAVDHYPWQGNERIIYVSCDPATLARDAKLLTSKGFALQQLAMMDMFPQTRHIEAMALFAAE